MAITANRLHIFSRALSQTSFVRNVATLVGGTTLSQGLLVLTSPIITRLYTPVDFGIWTLFLSLVGFLVKVVSWRYELSIVLPKEDKDASNLVVLSALIAAVMSVLSLLIVGFFRYQLAQLLGSPELAPWLWGMPFLLLLIGFYQVGDFWSTRRKHFGLVTISRVSQSIGVVISQIGAALFAGGGPSGLLLGTFVGQSLATGILNLPMWKEQKQFLKNTFSWASIPNNIHKYKNFPLYTAPYGLIANISHRLLFVVIGIYATPYAVGLFALAMRIMYLPMTLISGALRQVFFQKAAMELKSENLEPFVVKALTLLVITATPMLVFIFFNAPWIFAIIFGNAWTVAGNYATLLSLAGFMLLIASWLDRVFDVLGRQRLALLIQSIYDITSIGLFTLTLMWLRNTEWAIGIYSTVTVIYNAIWLVIIFRIAKFSLARLSHLGLIFLSIILIAGTTHWIMRMLFPIVGAAAVYVVLMVTFYVYLAVKYIGEWRQNLV